MICPQRTKHSQNKTNKKSAFPAVSKNPPLENLQKSLQLFVMSYLEAKSRITLNNRSAFKPNKYPKTFNPLSAFTHTWFCQKISIEIVYTFMFKVFCKSYSICLIFTSTTNERTVMIKQHQNKMEHLFWHGVKNCSGLLTAPSISPWCSSLVNKKLVQVIIQRNVKRKVWSIQTKFWSLSFRHSSQSSTMISVHK